MSKHYELDLSKESGVTKSEHGVMVNGFIPDWMYAIKIGRKPLDVSKVVRAAKLMEERKANKHIIVGKIDVIIEEIPVVVPVSAKKRVSVYKINVLSAIYENKRRIIIFTCNGILWRWDEGARWVDAMLKCIGEEIVENSVRSGILDELMWMLCEIKFVKIK